MVIRHVLGICVFALVLWGFLSFLPAYTLESDHELIRLFGEHREDIEELRKMIGEDVNVRWVYTDLVYLDGVTGPWRTDSDGGFSSKRLAAYNFRFDRLRELNIIYISKKDGAVAFSPSSFASRHIDDSYEFYTLSKGIVYSENPLAVVESLDNLGFETGGIYYRSIGDNWYLYREFGISKPE